MDSGNDRVIKVSSPTLQSLTQQADIPDLGQLGSCTCLRESDHAGVKVLHAKDCFVSLPGEMESTTEQLALITGNHAGSRVIAAQIRDRKLDFCQLLPHAQSWHLPLDVSLPRRTV